MVSFVRRGHSLFCSLSVLLALALQLPTPCPAEHEKTGEVVIVPAYFYPGTGGPGGVGDGWAAMAAAAAQVPVIAVFNPDSGPVLGPPDPNYVAAMTNLERAGGKAVAYVFTDYGTIPVSNIESQINTYISQYGGLINGFFIDGMLVDPTTLSYYQSLYTYIKGLSPTHLVIGNPGQPFLNGVTPRDYLSTADIFNLFEGDNAAFWSYPTGETWYQRHPRSRFSNLIYGVSGSVLMLADISRAEALDAGYVYITDQGLPNPYGQLPSYWDQELTRISGAK